MMLAIIIIVFCIGLMFWTFISWIVEDKTSSNLKRSRGDRMRVDFGCKEDFSQRYEDDPWSMFRG